MITRHRKCADCGYDLFGLSPPCGCPECGRKIKACSNPKRPKNPRRQAAQYRALARRRQALLKTAPPLAAICCIAASTSFWLGWDKYIAVVFGLMASGLLIGYFADRDVAARQLEKADALERGADPGGAPKN